MRNDNEMKKSLSFFLFPKECPSLSSQQMSFDKPNESWSFREIQTGESPSEKTLRKERDTKIFKPVLLGEPHPISATRLTKDRTTFPFEGASLSPASLSLWEKVSLQDFPWWARAIPSNNKGRENEGERVGKTRLSQAVNSVLQRFPKCPILVVSRGYMCSCVMSRQTARKGEKGNVFLFLCSF